MALESQGVVINVGTADSPSAYHAVGSVISFSGPGGSASVIDTTTLASTAKEKMMGLPDEGEFTMEVLVDNTDTNGQVALKTARTNRTLKYFKVVLTDSPQTYGKFTGYVLGYAINGSVDNVVKASITIAIDGAVTWG